MDLETLRGGASWVVVLVALAAPWWLPLALGDPWWLSLATLAVGGCVLIGWIALGLVSNLLLLLADHRDRDRI